MNPFFHFVLLSALVQSPAVFSVGTPKDAPKLFLFGGGACGAGAAAGSCKSDDERTTKIRESTPSPLPPPLPAAPKKDRRKGVVEKPGEKASGSPKAYCGGGEESTGRFSPDTREKEEKETDATDKEAVFAAKLALLQELLPPPPPAPQSARRSVCKIRLGDEHEMPECAGADAGAGRERTSAREEKETEDALAAELVEQIKRIQGYKNPYKQGTIDGENTYCKKFKIDRNPGTCFDEIQHCEDQIKHYSDEDRLHKKIVAYWMGFKIACINSIEEPFEQGTKDALKLYTTCCNSKKKYLEILETCNKNILEHAPLKYRNVDEKNLLYWTGVKLMLRTKMYEERDLVPPAFFLEWAKTDAQAAYNRVTYKHVESFCCNALKSAAQQTTEKALQMAEYWRRFKRNLEIRELTDF